MVIPQQAMDLENRSIGEDGESTLAPAYALLKECWDEGSRDREVGLHLSFLAWYGIVEPSHITGFKNDINTARELEATFSTVHAYFEPLISDDAEMLYAFGLPANMFWFMFEDATRWKRRAEVYRAMFRSLAPQGLKPAVFYGRGAYGDYFAGQSTVDGGY